MFRNILVSIDGSPHSDRALGEAVDIASGSNARLTIITAIPSTRSWVYTPANAAALEALGEDLERESHEILRAAVDRVPDSIPVTKIITHDPIRKALMRQVLDGCHDLLVMGSRGRGAVSASLLGSVSHFVLNHCRIPVLIVHEESEAAPEESAAAVAKAGAADRNTGALPAA
jgi:nucleotide-binding universal stress UspA family protein